MGYKCQRNGGIETGDRKREAERGTRSGEKGSPQSAVGRRENGNWRRQTGKAEGDWRKLEVRRVDFSIEIETNSVYVLLFVWKTVNMRRSR